MSSVFHPVLRLAAARVVLKRATAEGLVQAANTALCDGVYAQALGELAYLRNPDWRECDLLFLAAVRELGMELPPTNAAVRTVVDHLATGLVEGVVPPDDALAELYDVSIPIQYVEQLPATADLLRPFVELYYAAEDARGVASYSTEQGVNTEPDLTDLHAQCVRLAEGWCRDRWGEAVAPVRSSPTVVAIAEGIDAERAFDRLPILADALEDAGCVDPDILSHCRGDGEHPRRCWVVDLVLGNG